MHIIQKKEGSKIQRQEIFSGKVQIWTFLNHEIQSYNARDFRNLKIKNSPASNFKTTKFGNFNIRKYLNNFGIRAPSILLLTIKLKTAKFEILIIGQST